MKPDQKDSKSATRGDRIVPRLAFDFSKQSTHAVVVAIKDLSINYKETPIALANARVTAGNGELPVVSPNIVLS